MNVLVACEESQVVCKAFRDKGHNAYSCDIQECSGGHPEWHIKGDVLKFLNPCMCWLPGEVYGYGIQFCTMDGAHHFILNSWDLIIAHPPCTYLCLAGGVRMFNRDHTIKDLARYEKMLLARDFFFKCLEADCDKICVENPKPMAIAALPKCNCIVQPWQFGDRYTKKTYLWLKGLPPLMPLFADDEAKVGYVQTIWGSKKRSKTFPGIAKAMADTWG